MRLQDVESVRKLAQLSMRRYDEAIKVVGSEDEMYRYGDGDEFSTAVIMYRMKSGRLVSRRIYVPVHDDEALNLLDPMKEESRQRKAILNSADGIYLSLIEIYRDTLAMLRESLDREEIYSEPNEFAFAAADNFVDDLVRRNTDSSSLNVIKIDTQWRALYRYIRGDVWQEEFGNSQAKSEAFAKISGPLSTALTLCDNMDFNFTGQGE